MQDLEKQLAQTRQEANHLRSLVRNDSPFDVPRNRPVVYRSQTQLGSIPSFPEHQKSNLRADFSKARRNLVTHGQGVIKSPFSQSPAFPPPTPKKGLPQLPPRYLADTLMQKYFESIPNALPILHWQSFTQQYENVYQKGSFQFVPHAWAALFFAMLACGSLYDRRGSGQTFLEISQDMMDFWTDSPTLDHVASALLTSLYFLETNRRSAGWTMLGYALRAAQDLGLHREKTYTFADDGEICRRVWWSVYIFDR